MKPAPLRLVRACPKDTMLACLSALNTVQTACEGVHADFRTEQPGSRACSLLEPSQWTPPCKEARELPIEPAATLPTDLRGPGQRERGLGGHPKKPRPCPCGDVRGPAPPRPHPRVPAQQQRQRVRLVLDGVSGWCLMACQVGACWRVRSVLDGVSGWCLMACQVGA